ncbi:MAG: hypothetical protein AVDCRST_MAG90-2717, partial [uncultured Microvirga sp.]
MTAMGGTGRSHGRSRSRDVGGRAWSFMQPLLQLSAVIDEFNRRFGQIASWMVLFSCLISAGNAFSRY